MARILWDSIGERVFQTGVDRGVLYLDNVGVPWNGLVSVTDSPISGEMRAYYLDGVKYYSSTALEEFSARIKAITYPDEFARCDGSEEVQWGLSATQQKRESFGLSYRTKIGNDTEGVEYSYKIHLVYRATAAPSQKSFLTIGEESVPTSFEWDLTVVPPIIPGFRPTGHFEIDVRNTPADLLEILENILYGSEDTSPRLPDATELLYIFNNRFQDGGSPTDSGPVVYDGGSPSSIPILVLDGGVV